MDQGVIQEENEPVEFFTNPKNPRLKEFLFKGSLIKIKAEVFITSAFCSSRTPNSTNFIAPSNRRADIIRPYFV